MPCEAEFLKILFLPDAEEIDVYVVAEGFFERVGLGSEGQSCEQNKSQSNTCSHPFLSVLLYMRYAKGTDIGRLKKKPESAP
jgi:hypothetical protein